MSDESNVTSSQEPPGRAPAPGARRGAVWWGTALILVGAALLIGQFVPGLQPWRFWPLIIVVLGVRQMFGPVGKRWSVRHLAEGLTTVALGLVLLGQMTGYLAWDVWLNVLRLWPLLLVSLGLEIIGKAVRNEWLRALGGVVIAAGLVYAALVMSPASTGPFWIVGPIGQTERFAHSAPHEAGISEGSALVEGGVGTLKVTGGSDLVSAEGATPFVPVFDVNTSGSKADVRVGLGDGAWWPAAEQTRLDVALDRRVRWDLRVNAGVTSYDVDLRDLSLDRLEFNAGVSEGTLTLGEPATEAVPATVAAGVSSITLRVPQEYPVRLTFETGLTDINVRGEWASRRDGNKRIYESPGFKDAEPYWDVAVKAGVGAVTAEYY